MHNGSCCVGTLEFPVLSHQWPSSPNGFEPTSSRDLLWPAQLVGSSGAWWAQHVDRNGATVSVSACHAPLPAFCRWSFGSMSRDIRDVCEGAAIQSGIQLNFPWSLENTVQDGDSRGVINLLHSASTLNRGHSLKKNKKPFFKKTKRKISCVLQSSWNLIIVAHKCIHVLFGDRFESWWTLGLQKAQS